MASKTLTKDTPEFKMFGEYYNLVQKFYIVERTDEYWDALVKEGNEFFDKWSKTVPISRELVNALLNYQERMQRLERINKDGG